MKATEIRNGIASGLVGGIVFGMMMGMMGMLPMIGQMVGQPTVTAGFIVHMGMSAAIGAVFAATFGRFANTRSKGLAAGLAYGGIWWVLGPLTVMPWLMGMGFAANLNRAAMSDATPSLLGHLIYGLLLGLVYARRAGKQGTCPQDCELAPVSSQRR